MSGSRYSKIERVLGIYTRLMDGILIKKAEEAGRYGVDLRSIQRDIDDIRNFLEQDAEERGFLNTVTYDYVEKGYRLEQIYKVKLNNSEILAICKILLDSRAFTKAEMSDILGRLVSCCVPKSSQKAVQELIRNEEFHYVELKHRTRFLEKLWEIGQAAINCRYIEMEYQRTKDKALVKRKVKPLAIMFSEYYFYLTAFIEDGKVREHFEVVNDSFPTIYRIDRIKDMKVLEERFHIPYSSRFEEGEFRKRIQFMYGGRIRKIQFQYLGPDIDTILDRLPTARVLKEEDGVYTVAAEVFGKGIDMWLRMQGEYVEVM